MCCPSAVHYKHDRAHGAFQPYFPWAELHLGLGPTTQHSSNGRRPPLGSLAGPVRIALWALDGAGRLLMACLSSYDGKIFDLSWEAPAGAPIISGLSIIQGRLRSLSISGPDV
jgi:hypothetical protein